MSFVVTLQGLVPPARYDSLPWTSAKIKEASSPNGPWTLIDTIALTPLDTDPASPGLRNLTTSQATLSSGWYQVSFVDAASHVHDLRPVSNPSGILVSLARLKRNLHQQNLDVANDALLLDALAAASAAVLNYTERDFGSPSITETRTYLYEGEGVLEIDDATAVTAVTINYPNAAPLALQSYMWFAQPLERPLGVYTWLQVPNVVYGARVSRAMGFTYNLDTYPEYSQYPQPTTIAVTGTFGWPNVPEDVQQAVEWTAVPFAKQQDSTKASEAIEGYSQSWFPQTQGGVREEAIPQKAKDLLAPYVKVVV